MQDNTLELIALRTGSSLTGLVVVISVITSKENTSCSFVHVQTSSFLFMSHSAVYR